MLTGLNHVTVAVKDIERSLQFYTDLLGLSAVVRWNTGAYLSLGDLWLCLSVGNTSPAQDYSHIAFSVAEHDFDLFCAGLENAGVINWKSNSSEGASYYLLDPDGHKLEVHVGDLQTRLRSLKQKPYEGLQWL